ncbi:MAG: DNA-3-methyladenine glycosylase 2 family protein [Fidelibacterota bacterium]|nr:MAG: DNA-3-methyladenine glycosylase 2 family protein [Candidatus Neomarinimicrobiota bacterium]
MTVSLHLTSKGPTDLALCNQPVTENQSDRTAFAHGTLYRVARIHGIPVTIRASSTSMDEIEFRVSPAGDAPLPAEDTIVAALHRKFSLDLDLPAFYRFVQDIPALTQLPSRQKGLRPILKDSLFEALSLAIIDQQVNVAFAATLKHRLLEAYGHHYRVDGQDIWLFPTAVELARLDPLALYPLQFTRNKSRYIIELAQRFVAEPHWETLTGPEEEIITQLCTLRGIGRWTAEYAAMVGLGLVDTLPAADIGLLRMVQRVYHMPERPSEQQVRELGQDWSPWRGLVTFYLWHQEDSET